MRAVRMGMVARLYSFATLSDEEEPTKKAPIFIAAYAREFEEDLPTDVRRLPLQMHTEPMARPPVRGPAPASDTPPPLHQSGVVRCLTPISMEISLGSFRAEAANEVTMAADVTPVLVADPPPARATTTTRTRVSRAIASALFAGASLVALYALGMRTPRIADDAPHVVVIAGASLAHETPRTKRAQLHAPPVRRTLGSPTPLPPPIRSRSLIRTPPF